MKNMTRLFVLALVATGIFATSATASTKTAEATIAPQTSFVPIPTCPPGDPNGCGMRSAGY